MGNSIGDEREVCLGDIQKRDGGWLYPGHAISKGSGSFRFLRLENG